MSVVNVTWSPTRVVLAVDTAVGVAAGLQGPPGLRPGSTCKLLPMPGIGLVLAGRGPISLLPLAAFALTMQAAAEGLDVDGLMAAMPNVIRGAHAQARADLEMHGMPPEAADLFEVVACGWSPSLGRMRALSWWHGAAADDDADTDTGLQELEIDDDCPVQLLPTPGPADEAAPLNDHQMATLVRKQVAAQHAKGRLGYGGRLLIAECTRSRMSVVDHGPIVTRPAPAAPPVPGSVTA